MANRRKILTSLPLLVSGALIISACGENLESAADNPSETADQTAETPAGDGTDAAAGVRLVSPDEAAAIVAEGRPELVVLDVRTAEEFAEGHLEGATMLDFYQADFADNLAELDRDTPYVLYCRSGNRSGQARTMMADLGFSSVVDVDGGITAWTGAGLPLVAD